MRTTLAIDDDVFLAVQQLARRDKTSLGAKTSEILRRGLMSSPQITLPKVANTHPYVLIPADGSVVTSEMVYQLMDEEGI